MQVQEIKRRLDGSRQVFYCDALLMTPEAAILRFTATEDYSTDPSTQLPHRVTEGYFWVDRPYLLYKMFGDGEQVIGYRFDVCTDVAIGPDAVQFTDLVLDFWVDPQRQTSQFMDEDELAAAVTRGLLTAAHQATIEQARAELSSNFRAVIADAERLRDQVSKA